MKLARRQFLHLAGASAVLPALPVQPSRAQRAPSPTSVPAPSASERAAMGKLANAFMQTYDVPALSFAVTSSTGVWFGRSEVGGSDRCIIGAPSPEENCDLRTGAPRRFRRAKRNSRTMQRPSP
jgi:hypothetical protein